MAQEVQDVVARLTADGMPVAKELTATEKRFDQYARRVDDVSKRVESSLTAMLGPVGQFAEALAGKVDVAAKALTNLEAKAAGAKAELAGFAAEAKTAQADVKTLGTDAKQTGKDLGVMATEARGAGAGITTAAVATRSLSQALTTASATGARAMANLNRSITTTASRMNATVRATRTANRASGAGGGEAGFALTQAGGTLMQTGLALAAPLIAGAVAVNSFDEAVQKAAGNTNLAAAQVEELKQNVIALAHDTNAPIEQIAGAFMRASNFGFTGAQALTVVRAANVAAVASGTDLDKVTLALAQTMNQFEAPAKDAASVMSLLKYNADATNQTLKDYVSNCARGFQAAATLGIGLADAAAIMGVLTKSGLNAAQSQTAFRAIVKGIIAPTKQAREEIKALADKTGIDLVGAFSAAGVKHYGMVGVMNMVAQATRGDADELKKLFTDQRNFIPILTLLISKHKDLADVLEGDKQKFSDHSLMMDQYGEATKKTYYQVGELRNRALITAEGFEKQLGPAMLKVVDLCDRLLGVLSRLSPGQKEMLVNTLAGGAAFTLLAGALLTTVGRFVELVRGVKVFVLLMKDLPKLLTTLLGRLGLVTTATEGLATAEAGAASAGVLAFGPASVLLAALAGLGLELYNLTHRWKDMCDAIDQARQKAKDFAGQQKAVSQNGELGALAVNEGQIAQARSDLQDQITAQKQQTAMIAGFRKKGDTLTADNLLVDMKGNPERFGDTNDGGLQRMAARLAQMNRDYKKEKEREAQLSRAGVGAGLGASARLGADGFALAVSRLDPRAIIVDKVGQTCANFVSKVFQKAGLHIDTINGARALRDKIMAMGGKAHGGPALPGDLVYYSGGRYTQGGRSGHVGYGVGDGTDWESSRGRTKRGNIQGNLAWGGAGAQVQFITVPGSTFRNLPPALPSYVTGGGGAKAVPGADTGGKKKTPFNFLGAGASVKGLEQMVPGFSAVTASMKALANATTDVTTVKSKLAAVDENLGRQQDALAVRLAQGKGTVYENGKALDANAVQARRNGIEIAALTQRISIHLNAIRNGRAAEAAETARAEPRRLRHDQAYGRQGAESGLFRDGAGGKEKEALLVDSRGVACSLGGMGEGSDRTLVAIPHRARL